ncbi:MAG: tyrosine--tRNA ligase [Betaproteobacteria bacterium]|nr:MAG: tyrosine--tRNA ligase [Betaproteobacteria bacterium]
MTKHMSTPHILDELKWRGLIHQSTDETELRNHLNESRTLYCGFDPSASSLHVGNLVALMTLRRFQRFGHKPLALVGGATGMIGDPSGKSEERNLLSKEQLAENVAGIKKQVERFLDFDGLNAAQLVNNYDWTAPVSYLDFLRDVGKHVTINTMMAKDSVRSRIERPDAGISYTEFSYMLLQAFDFAEQFRRFGCTMQIGGSDQWGNITAGIDLGRRMAGANLFGLTMPLLLTSDGSKMGKSAKGALWLDSERTSPYAFYQYWINVADVDAGNCLRFLTELSRDEIEALGESTKNKPGERAAQKALAQWLTRFVHGDAGLTAARKATDIFFGAEIDSLNDTQLTEIFADVPSVSVTKTEFESGISLVDALTRAGLCASKGDAKRALAAGAIALNNRRLDTDRALTHADRASESVIVLRNGKKRYALLRIA